MAKQPDAVKNAFRLAAIARAKAQARRTLQPQAVYEAGGYHGDESVWLWCELPPGGFPGASIVEPPRRRKRRRAAPNGAPSPS